MVELEAIDTVCFCCGSENPYGLKMRFSTDGQKLYSTVSVPDYMRGWHNLVHGGIISALLDEAMAWSAIHLLKRFILTKEINVRFRKPILIETELNVSGWVHEHVDERRAIMAAQIEDGEGNVCATAQGEFALFDAEAFEKMDVVGAEVIAEVRERQ